MSNEALSPRPPSAVASIGGGARGDRGPPTSFRRPPPKDLAGPPQDSDASPFFGLLWHYSDTSFFSSIFSACVYHEDKSQKLNSLYSFNKKIYK